MYGVVCGKGKEGAGRIRWGKEEGRKEAEREEMMFLPHPPWG